MGLTLDIDGNKVENPRSDDIERAFEALSKGKGSFTGPGLTLAILARDEAHLLTATGTRDEGFFLSYQDGDADFEYNTGLEQAVTFEEAVKIFQAYALGVDWGQANFKWERMQLRDKTSNIIKRLVIISILGFLALALARTFIGK